MFQIAKKRGLSGSWMMDIEVWAPQVIQVRLIQPNHVDEFRNAVCVDR